jgi:hypothetical protein
VTWVIKRGNRLAVQDFINITLLKRWMHSSINFNWSVSSDYVTVSKKNTFGRNKWLNGWSKAPRTCITDQWNYHSLSVKSSISDIIHLSQFPNERADVPFQNFIVWTGQAGRLLSLSPPIWKRNIKMLRVRRKLRHLLLYRQTEIWGCMRPEGPC